MHRTLTIMTTVTLLGLSATGCAFLAPGEGHGGGSATMGDAIAAATADSSTKVRRMKVGHETPPVAETEVAVGGQSVAPDGSNPTFEMIPPTPRPRSRPLFGLVGGVGFLGGEDYDHYETFGITGGNFETGRTRWDLMGTMSSVTFKGESSLGHAFLDAMDLELDVSGRYYLTAPQTFVGLYGIAGLGTGTLFWNYARRLPVIQDGVTTTVGDDHLNHFDCFAGVGTSILQIRHLHVGGNLVGGVRFYGWHTVQGFDNTELPTTGFVRILTDIEFRR